MRGIAWGRLLVLLGLLVGGAACVGVDVAPCEDGSLCGAGQACAPGGGCADLGNLVACADLEDRDPCETDDGLPGVCRQGVCLQARCGNGVRDPGEACDDGNALDGDGCARDCLSDETCGNGVRDAGEACDDGNLDDGDACQADCALPACGDGVLDPLEACDDGNATSGDGCAAGCGSDETCGNDVVDVAAGEECDDGNLDDHDGCQGSCRVQRCGDGVLDGDAGEACDDGNLASGDGCAADCLSDETCGNDVVDAVAGEQCDAGAGQSYDGCSSDCAAELPVWRPWLAPVQPVVGVAMAGDPAHGRVVAFGGQGGTAADTWVLEDDRWTRLTTVGAPSARDGAAMVYDSDRQRLVLFGGYDPLVGNVGDTWELDGNVWTQVPTATSPTPRSNPAMAYDPVRHRVVVHGGLVGDTTTWEYDGVDWTPVNLATAPAPGYGPRMAFAASLNKVLLFGGFPGVDNAVNDTWTYDGAAWVKLNPAAKPLARYNHGQAVDPVNNRVVVFGGDTAFGDADDTWEFTGGTWVQRTTTTRPIGRRLPALAPDPVSGTLRVFGGMHNGVAQADTWRLLPTTWTAAALAPSAPPPRRDALTGYDEASGEVVAFGGYALGSYFADTWRFDGVQWRTQGGPVPAALLNAAMAYDARQQRFIYFGGVNTQTSSYSDETWALSAAGWQQLAPAAAPARRAGHAMAFDRVRGVTVLYGGGGDAGNVAETWEFDGTTWSQATPLASPPPCAYHELAYDDARARTVMRCAYVFPVATWEYDGTTWTQVAAGGTPGAFDASMAYDPLRRRVVLWSGERDYVLEAGEWTPTLSLNRPTQRLAAGLAYLGRRRAMVLVDGETLLGATGEVHVLQLSTSDPIEACTAAGEDPDGDGLAGCADPDCAARCTPHCPPGASCADEATLPRCGDGACNAALEDAALCPADCA